MYIYWRIQTFHLGGGGGHEMRLNARELLGVLEVAINI